MTTPPPTPARSRRRWLGLAVLSLGVSMIIVDATVVNVALPTIIADLGLKATDAEWLNTIYAGHTIPWFGNQLVAGNSLVGARREVYPTDLLCARPGAGCSIVCGSIRSIKKKTGWRMRGICSIMGHDHLDGI